MWQSDSDFHISYMSDLIANKMAFREDISSRMDTQSTVEVEIHL